MSVETETLQRRSYVASSIILVGLAALSASMVSGREMHAVTLGVALCVVCALTYRRLFTWPTLLAALIVIILFVPIRRYRLPGSLPFDIEPYRLFIVLLVGGWLASLLVDRRLRLRSTGFDGPLLLIGFIYLMSVAVNTDWIVEQGLGVDVVKGLTFFASFLIVPFLFVSVIRCRGMLDFVIKLIVAAGAVVAVFAIAEAATGKNAFNSLDQVIPILDKEVLPFSIGEERGGRLRVYASAEHSIALSAAFVMLLPLAIYLVRSTRRGRWWIAAVLLLLGNFATVSRTGVIMLIVLALVYLWLRPAETKRVLVLALVPTLLALHVALPGTIGGLREAFFPKGGIVASEREGANTRGSGRVADIAPTIAEWSQRPLLGQGYGTRIIDKPRQNARILDDQWLATLLEVGAAGLLAWIWLFLRVVRSLGRRAKDDVESPLGWLMVGVAASVSAYAIGMVTYDAFSFVQSTMILFILIGLGAVALQLSRANQRS